MDARTTKLLYGAGGTSVLTSFVHGALTSAHFSEWWVAGVVFTLAALGQGLYGFVILSSHAINGAPVTQRWPPATLRAFFAAGIAGNGLLVLAYVATRTTGLFGVAEPWDGLGVFTKLLEGTTIACLALLLARSRRAPSSAGSTA